LAYIYINENSPEESEYISNYIFFDEKEPGVLKKMMQKCLNSLEASPRDKKGYELLDDEAPSPLQFA